MAPRKEKKPDDEKAELPSKKETQNKLNKLTTELDAPPQQIMLCCLAADTSVDILNKVLNKFPNNYSDWQKVSTALRIHNTFEIWEIGAREEKGITAKET